MPTIVSSGARIPVVSAIIFHRDPQGEPFDNYCNAMNGQFVRLDERRALYVFGHFQYQQDRHRTLCVEFSWN